MGERNAVVVRGDARGEWAAARINEPVSEPITRERAEPELGVVVRKIPVGDIEPDASQPRRVFDEEERVRSLAENVREYGLVQELGVMQLTRANARRFLTG